MQNLLQKPIAKIEKPIEKLIVDNKLNRELMAIDKEIQILAANIGEIKKQLDMKICQVEYYKKRKTKLLTENLNINHPPATPATPATPDKNFYRRTV